MKYITIFHANLNYAYLTPGKYEFVIRNAYELIFDTLRDHFPSSKYVFESSGYTIEQIAEKTPDVLEKLKDAIDRGQCEFMGSPYAHPMLPNFPEEDGLWSIKFSNETYQKHLGFVPKSFWNPECGWRNYVPKIIADAGYLYATGDFEAYSRSMGLNGKPLRPEIYEKEVTDDVKFYNFGFKYDLPGNEKAVHFPFNNVVGSGGRLKMFLRTDRVCQYGVRFFMGMEGYTLEKYMKLIKYYSQQNPNEQEGAMIIFADDAEYIGTNGWFKLKFQNQPDNVFEKVPDAQEKLINLLSGSNQLGEFVTFEEACKLPPIEDPLTFGDDSAWHGAKASTWANTPMARALRPWQDMVRIKLRRISNELSSNQVKQAWYFLTNSYNSDGQWPPTLPDAPHIIHPFNYKYCYDNLIKAERMVGGIDRSELQIDPSCILREVLSIQQSRIMDKIIKHRTSTEGTERNNAKLAHKFLMQSMDMSSIKKNRAKIINANEYKKRANALIKARRLVGGIQIETV